ncbi:hypothetical protein ACLUXW_05080 [Limosilactobacillus reuteri subsp. suis]
MKFELDLMGARQEGKEEGIKESKQKLVQFLSSQNTDPAEIVAALVNVYQVPEKAAQEYVEEYLEANK